MQLIVLTPEQELYSGEITSISLPGIEGSFQILENHAPMVSALSKGSVVVKSNSGEDKTFEIEKGFVEILKNKVSLLVESLASDN